MLEQRVHPFGGAGGYPVATGDGGKLEATVPPTAGVIGVAAGAVNPVATGVAALAAKLVPAVAGAPVVAAVPVAKPVPAGAGVATGAAMAAMTTVGAAGAPGACPTVGAAVASPCTGLLVTIWI